MKGDGDPAVTLRRRLVRAGVETGAAFALWREPGADAARGLLAAPGAPSEGPLDLSNPRPGLAVSRFDNFSGDRCLTLAAELLLTPDGLRFAGADGRLAEAPGGETQRALLEAVEAADPDAPAIPRGAPILRAAAMPHRAGEAEYRALVARAVAAIRDGRFDKVVASRAAARPLPPGFDHLAMFERLSARYPHAYVGLTGIPGVGLWIVATPETLLRVEGARIFTMALAGTQPVGPDTAMADVLWSDKFVEEQALVARYIRREFEACGIAEYEETGPRTVRAANLAHLCSRFEARDPGGAAPALLLRLHPTSAVSGMPRQAAIDFLAAEEGYDRSYYCGFLGPIGIDKRSSFYVNLRSAQFVGDEICLYVGAGVTGASDPAAEWQETVEKTRTLGALVEAD